MSSALQTDHHDLAVTVLSPVHIGCGEDFVPTGYVIQDGWLYAFDPAAVPLSDNERRDLLARANRSGTDAILAVQRFFAERASLCIGAAQFAVPVSPAVQAQYEQRIGRAAAFQGTGQTHVNQLTIERTAHHPHTGVPYLPGSSLKGAIRTAWLNQLVHPQHSDALNHNANKLEETLLGGKFETDPFRFVSVSDAQGSAVQSEIIIDTPHKKSAAAPNNGRRGNADGPPVRREAIVAGQYAALRCHIAVHRPMLRGNIRNLPNPARCIGDWQALAHACNRFYLPRLEAELQLLENRRLAAPEWLRAMRALLPHLQPAIAAGNVALLRVGRHSGFEHVTLDHVRQLRSGATASTTISLATREASAASGHLPFGWILLHPIEPEHEPLRQWCAQQPKPTVADAHTRIQQERAKLQQSRAALEQAQAQRRAEEARLQEEKAREAQRLAALSPQGQLVEALRKQLLQHTAARKQPISGILYQKTRELIQRAESEGNWSPQDKAALAELLTTLVPEKIDLGSKAKEIRQAAQRLAANP